MTSLSWCAGAFQQAFVELAGAAGLNRAALEAAMIKESLKTANGLSARIQAQARVCQQGLGLAAGMAAVVTNGRLIPVGPGGDQGIVAEDFRLMETWARNHQLSSRVRLAALEHSHRNLWDCRGLWHAADAGRLDSKAFGQRFMPCCCRLSGHERLCSDQSSPHEQ